MYYNVPFVGGDVVVGRSEVECSAKVLADERVEFFDVKTNKTVMLFIFNGFELFDHRCGNLSVAVVSLSCTSTSTPPLMMS